MKVTVNGKEVEGTPVDFQTVSEPWSEYHMKDGTVLRVRPMITRIYVTEEKAPDGSPVYSFHHQMAVDIASPDKLR